MVDLSSQIKRNCDISDAWSWGFYSICGLLLKLRELYISEHGLEPWEKIEHKEIADWIARKEAIWKELDGAPFQQIEIEGDRIEPFEAAKINSRILGNRLVYGAGYGPFMKATFFIADLTGNETRGDLKIYISGREHARDLSSAVAMLKENTILVRTEPARNLIWQKYEEYRSKGKGAHALAFESYGVNASGPEPKEILDRIAPEEIEVYIRHELGEAAEGKRLGPRWAEILSSSKEHKTVLFLRAVKDLLADTSSQGSLSFIINEKRKGSLGFYILFLAGYRKLLSRRIEEAFDEFLRTDDWGPLQISLNETHSRMSDISEKIIQLYSSGQGISPFVQQFLTTLK